MGNEKAMYEERTYRRTFKPTDLLCYEVRWKETDLLCCTSADVKSIIEDRVLFYRNQLESYISRKPEFLHSLAPVVSDPLAPAIIKEMIVASSQVGVGPMACVAGAVAEFVGRDVNSLCDEYIIENGGDICLRTVRERNVVVYAGDSLYSEKVGIRLQPRETAYGVCTSSATVGPSLSLGKADAVCLVGTSALFLDGLATMVGNLLNKESDIDKALEAGRTYPGVSGILVIIGRRLGVWGDLDLIKI